MCGIVGYIGHNSASTILISGLKRLEYRGYDSSGIALVKKEGIDIYKKKGKIYKRKGNVTKSKGYNKEKKKR